MKYKVEENKSCYHGITKHKNGIFYLTNIEYVLPEFVDIVRLMFFSSHIDVSSTCDPGLFKDCLWLSEPESNWGDLYMKLLHMQ